MWPSHRLHVRLHEYYDVKYSLSFQLESKSLEMKMDERITFPGESCDSWITLSIAPKKYAEIDINTGNIPHQYRWKWVEYVRTKQFYNEKQKTSENNRIQTVVTWLDDCMQENNREMLHQRSSNSVIYK